MIIKDNKIYCEICDEWFSISPCNYLLVNDSVECMNLHHLGYIWDLFPCEYFVEEYGNKTCKCEFNNGGQYAITNCNGNEDKCNYPTAKKNYEEDRKEINEK